MKKIVLTAVAVGLAAVAAHAQGTGDGGVTSAVWGRYYDATHSSAKPTTKPATTTTTTTRTVSAGAAEAGYFAWNPSYAWPAPSGAATGTFAYTAAQQKAEDKLGTAVAAKVEEEAFRHAEALAAQEDQAATEEATVKENPATTGAPTYYYGREGKVLALGEVTERALKNKKAPKKAEPAKESTGNWFTRMMGFDKFEGESDTEWQARLQSMAIK